MGEKRLAKAFHLGLDLGLTGNTARVYGVMAFTVHDDDNDPRIYMSRATLAEKTGIHVRQVTTALADLLKAGCIEQTRKAHQNHTTAEYRLLFPAGGTGVESAPVVIETGGVESAPVVIEPGVETTPALVWNPPETGVETVPLRTVLEDITPEDTIFSSEVANATPRRDDVEHLLDILDAEIVRNGSKAPKRNKANRDAMRLLLDRDGRTPEQIERAIHWCQEDEFWRSNILSASKLREKYDQLRLDAQRKQQPGRRKAEQRQAHNLDVVAKLAEVDARRSLGLTVKGLAG